MSLWSFYKIFLKEKYGKPVVFLKALSKDFAIGFWSFEDRGFLVWGFVLPFVS